MTLTSRPVVPMLALSTALLSGCALTTTAPRVAEPAVTLRGDVHGGQQPIIGARVYLFAAGKGGYGRAATSLINSPLAASDSFGKYVLTDQGGGFTLTGTYLCAPGTQVYVLALGGNPACLPIRPIRTGA